MAELVPPTEWGPVWWLVGVLLASIAGLTLGLLRLTREVTRAVTKNTSVLRLLAAAVQKMKEELLR